MGVIQNGEKKKVGGGEGEKRGKGAKHQWKEDPCTTPGLRHVKTQ